jgi:methionine-rich copper-binding protein CopC
MVGAMKKILTSILVIASMSFIPAAGASAAPSVSAAQPAVTAKCAAATYKATLVFGRLNAAKAQFQVAKAARALAVKQKNARGIAVADAQMKSLTVEIAALTISYKNAEAAARTACK